MTRESHGKQFAAQMSDEVREQLLQEQDECTFIWQGKKDALGTIMSFVWADGCVWLTTNDSRPRVSAVRRTGRATVVISSAGTALGDSRCISLNGICTVMDDNETRRWFFPQFCRKLLPDNVAAQAAMQDMLDREGQVILRVQPEKMVAYDGDTLMRRLENL